MRTCPICQHPLRITKLCCDPCAVTYGGGFDWPRLARLSSAHQELAEQLLLAGGNISAMAQAVGMSYPTLKKRLDALRDALQRLRDEDLAASKTDQLRIEQGQLQAEQAARRIRERNGNT